MTEDRYTVVLEEATGKYWAEGEDALIGPFHSQFEAEIEAEWYFGD